MDLQEKTRINTQKGHRWGQKRGQEYKEDGEWGKCVSKQTIGSTMKGRS